VTANAGADFFVSDSPEWGAEPCRRERTSRSACGESACMASWLAWVRAVAERSWSGGASKGVGSWRFPTRRRSHRASV